MIEVLRKGVTNEHDVIDDALIEQLSSSRILAKKIVHSLKEIGIKQK